MPSRASTSSNDFSWLSPDCRPSPEEVETYANLINALEHNPPEQRDSCFREAELQLWIWRNEARQRALRRRRSARPVNVAAAEEESAAVVMPLT